MAGNQSAVFIATFLVLAIVNATHGKSPAMNSSKSTNFGPPPEIIGRCDAMCVLEEGSGYPCPYTPTYPVWFSPTGSFNWRAPYRDDSTVELGSGKILSRVKEIHHRNGSWEAQWFGGNHLLAPDSEHNVTHCACYYAKGIGKGQYWYLSNYGVASIENSSHLPVESVCQPYSIKCPNSNASAFERWGPPWIEAYLGCDPASHSFDSNALWV